MECCIECIFVMFVRLYNLYAQQLTSKIKKDITKKSKKLKNVFGMLILLSARLDTVSGASWICEFSSGVLALINLQLGEHKYFALGFSLSKSKA